MDTTTYKTALEAEKEKLLKELAADGNKNETTGEWEGASDDNAPAIDPNEAADQIEELMTNTPIVEELNSRLHAVDAALERIANGTYGMCENCGKEIPAERLAANPAATLCIECAA